jgi:hypothetical protein
VTLKVVMKKMEGTLSLLVKKERDQQQQRSQKS